MVNTLEDASQRVKVSLWIIGFLRRPEIGEGKPDAYINMCADRGSLHEDG